MKELLTELSGRKSVKSAIKANWEAYHYCLARSPKVKLSIGRYLTWLITDLPDHFMNLVVCNQLPFEGIDELIEARQMGYQIGILQTSKQGYNLYRRLGFQDYGKLSVYLWENDHGVA